MRDPLAAWVHHMRRGEFEEAWRICDALDRNDPKYRELPRHMRPVWSGASIAGKRVLISCRHGLGDTIQFIRYAPLVARVAAEVTVAAQPELVPLLSHLSGGDSIRIVNESAGTQHDLEVEVMELPYVFRTTLATIPAHVPYIRLAAPQAECTGRASSNGSRSDGVITVGLVWHAGGWDPARSIPLRLLETLGSIPHVQLHILQRGEALHARPDGFGMVTGADDPLKAARVIRSLDLVLTVDTMVAHLAGALGTPVWLMLRDNADWRWIEGRDDSPWYPGMRLFRQDREGDWQPVADRVTRALGELARTRARRSGRSTQRSARHPFGLTAPG